MKKKQIIYTDKNGNKMIGIAQKINRQTGLVQAKTPSGIEYFKSNEIKFVDISKVLDNY